jgi:hypothetical protein
VGCFALLVYGVSLLRSSPDESLEERVQARATADMIEGFQEL